MTVLNGQAQAEVEAEIASSVLHRVYTLLCSLGMSAKLLGISKSTECHLKKRRRSLVTVMHWTARTPTIRHKNHDSNGLGAHSRDVSYL